MVPEQVLTEINGVLSTISTDTLEKIKLATPAHIDDSMLDNVIETNKIIAMAALNDFFLLKGQLALDARRDYKVFIDTYYKEAGSINSNICYFTDRHVKITIQNIVDRRVLQVTTKTSENFFQLKMYSNLLLKEDRNIKDSFAPEMAAFPDAGVIQNPIILGKIYDFLVFGEIEVDSPASTITIH